MYIIKSLFDYTIIIYWHLFLLYILNVSNSGLIQNGNVTLGSAAVEVSLLVECNLLQQWRLNTAYIYAYIKHGSRLTIFWSN